MNWKNIIENLIIIVVMFVGLGIYTNMVLKPIIVTSINKETTKVENNINSKIDNKFKKIDELNTNLKNSLPIQTTLDKETTAVPTIIENCYNKDKYVLIERQHLTRRQRKRLGI